MQNIDITSKQSRFLDCSESIKQDIKEKIKDEESVTSDYFTESIVEHEIKDEVKDEGQVLEDFNLDTDNLVDCSQYVQVQMNLPKKK